MSTILIVDDQSANRDLLDMLLSSRGHEVVQAGDGRQALELVESRQPDLVITDALMPGLDGYELTSAIRGQHGDSVRVMVFSASYSEAEMDQIAAACGADRVIAKSADPSRLLTAVDEVLGGPARPQSDPAEDFAIQHLHAVKHKLMRTVQELSITEIRFNELAESAPVGIFLTDASGAAVYANPALSQITGIAEREFLGPGWQAAIGAKVAEEAESGDRPGRDLAASALRVGHGESNYRISRPDGSSRWIDLGLREVGGPDGLTTGYIGIVSDITDAVEAAERHQAEERRRAEELARRNAERLESLRRMAGGVAHDFNNLHASILGYAQLADETIAEAQAALRMPADLGRQLREDLRNLAVAARKASGLTTELLRFGGRVNFTPASAEVGEVIRRKCGQLAEAMPEQIELDVQLDPQLPSVNSDADRIAEILDCLVTNAIEALPGGGRISVTATTITAALEAQFDADASGSSSDQLTAGEYVLITVTDTGEGMTPQTLAHAIDPFFTTRPRPHAGLGLAATFGAVRQIGGDLVLASEPGHGTAAQVYLPITSTPAAVAAESAPAADGGQTVLVVDDEPGIRDISTRILRRSGWTVLSAASGQEALQLAAGHEGKIDCLLTDIVMPGMLGSELARQFAGQRPETRVIYMSGYADPMLDEDSPATQATMLAKPFTPSDLLAALRQAGPAD